MGRDWVDESLRRLREIRDASRLMLPPRRSLHAGRLFALNPYKV